MKLLDPADEQQQFSFTLFNTTVYNLRLMVRASGWAKTQKEMNRAGKLGKYLPNIADAKPGNKDWDYAMHEPITISESQRDTLRKCVKHFIEVGAIPNDEMGMEILENFGAPE
jgi:hypothetical protein